MKKFFLAVLVSVVFLCSVFGQNSGPKDLVLVLDTSSSMSDYSEEVSDYLIGPFLQEFLRLGDTFHLISFVDEPKLELTRRIRETGDVETIIARLLLMYPLVRYSDIVSAVDFAESYTSEIPGSRAKRVVFITDGKNNALPGSENAAITDDEISTLLGSALSSRFARLGAEVNYISVPLQDDIPGGKAPSSGISTQTNQQASSDVSSVEAPIGNDSPAQTGTETGNSQRETTPSPRTDIPSTQNSGTNPQNTGSSSPIQTDNQETMPGTPPNIDDSNSTVSPPVNGNSSNQTPSRPAITQGTTGTTETRRGNESSVSFFNNLSWPWILLLILIIALIIGLIIFFMSRKLHRSPGKAVYEASSYAHVQPDPAAQKNADMLASYAAGQRKGSGTQSPYSYGNRGTNDAPINGPLMLSLFVEDQNTAIGRRNIHNAKSGTTLTVGGGKSDFLMFLVPMPQHIAEVHFDGRNCTFVPRKPKHFPDIGSQSVPACIGKTIRVISEKNYELFIRIERFQDPLLELNRLMNSINLPGLPED